MVYLQWGRFDHDGGEKYNEDGDICTGGETLYRLQILRGASSYQQNVSPQTSYRCKVSGGRIYTGAVL